MLKKISFECRTITPMFMSGADGKSFELRAPSIKGALRFWWRAMNISDSVETLAIEETKIFGGTREVKSKGLRPLRSVVSISVHQLTGTPCRDQLPKHQLEVTSKGKKYKMNILDYLCYGTYRYEKGKGNIFDKQYLPSNSTFRLNLIGENDFLREHNKNLETVLELTLRVGGIGSRPRNGFGRCTIIQKNNGNITIQDLIKSAMTKFSKTSYTALSKDIRLFKLKDKQSTWDNALAEIGKIYKSARESLDKRHVYENRMFISSPIVNESKATVSLLERHTKSYFLFPNEIERDEFEGFILFLPYEYLSHYENPPRDLSLLKKSYQASTELFNNYLSSAMSEVIL